MIANGMRKFPLFSPQLTIARFTFEKIALCQSVVVMFYLKIGVMAFLKIK